MLSIPWRSRSSPTAPEPPARLPVSSERICNPQFYFDAGEPVRPQSDPGWESPPSRTSNPNFGCGYPWAIVGSQTDDEDATLPAGADWDYAVGSWLSGVAFLPPWGGSETWAGHGLTPDEKSLLGSIVFWPTYVDYAPWGGEVQTLATCGPTTKRPSTGSAAPPVVGTPSADTLAGGASRDRVNGAGGADTVSGAAGNDDVSGGAGADQVDGGPGQDTVMGGPGNDTANGGAGNDRVLDTQGTDTLNGGQNSDLIASRDGSPDVVNCGPGEDVAVVDPNDTVHGCEHVYDNPATDPATTPKVP
jgi:Ca2+-binding RTX toxin-like protein